MGRRSLDVEKARQMGLKGGRKVGFKLPRTIEKEVAKKHFIDRVVRVNDVLINSQLSLARGQTFLFKIKKEFVKTGEDKNGKEQGYWKNLKPEIVEDEKELQSYLETFGNDGDGQDHNDPSDAYYFLTTKEPNNNAIDSLYNRAFGKPKETIDLTGEVKFSLKDLAIRRAKLLEEHGGRIIDVPINDMISERVEDVETHDVQVVDEN